jgi:hypothetical protein
MKEFLYAVVIVRPDTKAVTAVVAGDRAYKGLSLSKVLEAGFLPVRETPMGGSASSVSLVLLERDGATPHKSPAATASAMVERAKTTPDVVAPAAAAAAATMAPTPAPAPPAAPTPEPEPEEIQFDMIDEPALEEVPAAQADDSFELNDPELDDLPDGLESVEDEPLSGEGEEKDKAGEASDINFDFLSGLDKD